MQNELWSKIFEAVSEEFPPPQNHDDLKVVVIKLLMGETYSEVDPVPEWSRDETFKRLRCAAEGSPGNLVRVCHRFGVLTPEERVQEAQVMAAEATVQAVGAAKSSAKAAKFSAITAGVMVFLAGMSYFKKDTVIVQPVETKVVVVQPPTDTQAADEPEATTRPVVDP